jgi:hypothetical protein
MSEDLRARLLALVTQLDVPQDGLLARSLLDLFDRV